MDTSENKSKPLPGAPETSQAAASSVATKRVVINPLVFFILGGVGFVLAAVTFALLAKTPAKKSTQKPAATSTVVVTQVVSPVSSLPANESVSVPKEEKPLPSLALSGILFSSGQSFALINGRVIPEGGLVDGALVEKISPETVELSFEGKKIMLRSR